MAGKSSIDKSGLVDVDANLFRAVYICASTEELRRYLMGVRVERHPLGGALLIATDGHRLMVIRDDAGWCRRPVTVFLDKSGLAACKPDKKFTPTATRLIVDARGISHVGSYVSPASAIRGGEYPDWRRVVPVKKWKFGTASFNAEYLASFGKIAQILGSPQHCIRVMCDEDAGAPALILFPHDLMAFGVLMPMCADVPPGGVPAWMQPAMEAKAKPKSLKTKRTAKKK